MALVTRVLYFEIGQEEASWTADLGEKQVYSMTHDKSGGLVILCDDGVYRYDRQGALTASHPFFLPVRLFAAGEGGEVLVAFETADRSSRTTQALVLGDGLESLWSGSLAGVPRALDCRGGTAALLMNDRLETIRYDGDAVSVRTRPLTGARDVAVNDSGDPILIYSDRAQRVPADSEEQP